MQLTNSKKSIRLRWIFKVSFYLICSTLIGASPTVPTGYTIIKKQDAMDIGYHDESSIGHMILIGTNGEKTERELESKTLEKQANEGTKSIVKFIKPADIQGTALLSIQNKNRDDDQWLYLPAMKKTKRIAGTGKSGSFVGSEFSYEDMIPPDIEKYSYQYLRSESCDHFQCFVIESTPQFTDSGYSKTRLWIRTDNYQTVKMDLYDKKGRHQKTALFEDLQLINNRFWRPFKVIIKNFQNGKETQLLIKELKIQSGLSIADFSQRALER